MKLLLGGFGDPDHGFCMSRPSGQIRSIDFPPWGLNVCPPFLSQNTCIFLDNSTGFDEPRSSVSVDVGSSRVDTHMSLQSRYHVVGLHRQRHFQVDGPSCATGYHQHISLNAAPSLFQLKRPHMVNPNLCEGS